MATAASPETAPDSHCLRPRNVPPPPAPAAAPETAADSVSDRVRALFEQVSGRSVTLRDAVCICLNDQTIQTHLESMARNPKNPHRVTEQISQALNDGEGGSFPTVFNEPVISLLKDNFEIEVPKKKGLIKGIRARSA